MNLLEFTLTKPTMTLNELRHMHHHAYRRAQIALSWEISLKTIGRRPVAPFERARVTITRYSVGVPDRDGLIGGMKSLIDCFLPFSKRHPRGLGFIRDDHPGVMELCANGIKVAHRSEQRTTVLIEDVTP